MGRRPPGPTLFPYTTLFRSTPRTNLFFMYYFVMTGMHLCHVFLGLVILAFVIRSLRGPAKPRRSEEHTLNSSHVAISYAVYPLKKKNVASVPALLHEDAVSD